MSVYGKIGNDGLMLPTLNEINDPMLAETTYGSSKTFTRRLNVTPPSHCRSTYNRQSGITGWANYQAESNVYGPEVRKGQAFNWLWKSG
jgi:hypothetical protein